MKQQQHCLIIIILAMAAILSALVEWSDNGAGHVPPPTSASPRERGGASRSLGLARHRDPKSVTPKVPAAGAGAPVGPEVFAVCGRTARYDLASWPRQQRYHNASLCAPYNYRTRRKVELRGHKGYGRTGNQLRTFLNAVQYARDRRRQLIIRQDSWAMNVILEFFMADDREDGDWQARMEERLCVKILPKHLISTIHGLRPVKKLFDYQSAAPREEYVASQLQIMRTLFQHYNTGVGHADKAVRDMCAGIDALFAAAGDGGDAGAGDAEDRRTAAVYSVLHLRSFEGQGAGILARVANRTGCDPAAALEMRPEYIKWILAPLGMLAHPIVVISDEQGGSDVMLRRLRGDRDIGPMLRVVPTEARWLGGDMTLAVMANIFIGNPASTLSGFLARSRVALGFRNNYMCLARDEHGEWTKVRGVLGDVS